MAFSSINELMVFGATIKSGNGRESHIPFLTVNTADPRLWRFSATWRDDIPNADYVGVIKPNELAVELVHRETES